jgi:hypothetical protein
MWKARLAATLYPWHIGVLDTVNRNALVKRWIAGQRGKLPTFTDVNDFYRFVNDDVCGKAPIDYLEFGVYMGRTMRFWSRMNTDPQSRFVGFDSFEGLPERWSRNFPAGAFDVGGEIPKVDDPRVSFVKGWFQHTLPGFLKDFTPRSRLVVHNDSDLYSSTLFALTSLHELLVPGSVIIFDEYSVAMHEFRAFEDYKSAFLRNARPVAMTADYATQVAFVFE